MAILKLSCRQDRKCLLSLIIRKKTEEKLLSLFISKKIRSREINRHTWGHTESMWQHWKFTWYLPSPSSCLKYMAILPHQQALAIIIQHSKVCMNIKELKQSFNKKNGLMGDWGAIQSGVGTYQRCGQAGCGTEQNETNLQRFISSLWCSETQSQHMKKDSPRC